jgi:cupin 2 domain-containing protein
MPSKIKINNFFNYPEININKEKFVPFLRGEKFVAEKIISNGFKSAGNDWMSEDSDEWVILLKGKAKLELENGEVLNLKPGDSFIIPANTKHKILYTSNKPFCCWLAIHYK